jgi:hypothetical protein
MLEVTGFYSFRFADQIWIDAPAQAGFDFFANMETNYLRWHPDHLAFEWREGRGLEVGNVFFFEERIGGKVLKKSTRITAVEPSRYFAFTPVNPVMWLFLPRLSFAFEPERGGFVFRAELRMRGIGPMGRKLNRKEFEAVEVHMAEEGANLKALLEGA